VALSIRKGDETMAAKKAPGNGVMRNEAGNARRVRAGALIPDGWTFDDGSDTPDAPAAKKGSKKPKEDMQAAGPSEAAETEETK
jgi:hypothetical protein